MSENLYLVCLTIVTAGVTFLLRAFPFLAFGRAKGGRPPKIVSYLGRMVSPAAIAMLVVYCFACYVRDRAPLDHMFGLAEIAASLTVIGLQLWKRNPLLSILAGTAVYMVLVQTVVP